MCGALLVVENEHAARRLREHYFCPWLAHGRLICSPTLHNRPAPVHLCFVQFGSAWKVVAMMMRRD